MPNSPGNVNRKPHAVWAIIDPDLNMVRAIGHNSSQCWNDFFGKYPNKACMETAIRAYEGIGFRCLEYRLTAVEDLVEPEGLDDPDVLMQIRGCGMDFAMAHRFHGGASGTIKNPETRKLVASIQKATEALKERLGYDSEC